MRAFDLARPSIFRWRDEARVRGYIMSPVSFNPEHQMPSFAGQLDPEDVDALVAYLRVVADR
jgi:mono/diheme cytochrome c family protein